jgi:hypothetical protein
MSGSSSVQTELAASADEVTDRDQAIEAEGCSHDDHQLPLQVYRS